MDKLLGLEDLPDSVMPEGEKHWGVPLVKDGQNLPPMVGIGLTDLSNIGGASGPPGLPVPASLY